MKGFFKEKGCSKKKMAILGFSLSFSMIILVILMVYVSGGGHALIEKMDLSGFALSVLMVAVFTITYAVEGRD